ncbi:MAG: GNAT family N-acetyltransferase [Acidaminococcaceae bacterium]|nr:GNAT family N-acetyltransferase [Acidaminococcaceae bacterium]
MKIEPLTPEIVLKFKNEITQFYYENMQTCTCLEHFTFEEARIKIEGFINHLRNNTCIGYGVFREDEICGYIWAYPHRFREENRMYVNEIRIRNEYRNRGYGKVLLKLVEEKAKEMGIGALYIHAEADNPDAIRLYETVGYVAERLQLRKEIAGR